MLQDNEAITYLGKPACLKKHKAKTRMLFTHVNAENLNDHEKQQQTVQRRRKIAAAARGARTEALNFSAKACNT